MAETQTDSVSRPGANPHATEIVAPAGADDSGDLAAFAEEDTTQQVDDPPKDKPDETPEDNVPPRLRGKSQAQIVEEFARLESEYGRQGNELGETRALLREFLEKTLQPPNTPESNTGDSTDVDLNENLDEDQARAVKGYVDKRVNTLEQEVVETRRALSRSEFARQHPKYMETSQSQDFQDWVGNSKYRQSLFKKADDYNWDAADELFSAWEEHTASQQTTDDEAAPSKTTKHKRDLRRNATETGGAGGKSSNNKKIFKSADLIRLYNEDRDKYNAMSAEIQQAFAEGRVK